MTGNNPKAVLVVFGSNVFCFSANYIAANLRKEGYDVSIVNCIPGGSGADLAFLPFSDRQMKMLSDFCSGAAAVGISVVATHYLKQAEQVDEWIGKKLGKPVVWGGVPVICDPEFYLGYAKFACTGEGEIFMAEFMKNIAEGKPLENTPGMAFRTDDGRIVCNPQIPLADLNELPLPLFNLEKHFMLKDRMVSFKEDPSFLFHQAVTRGYRIFPIRGCPFVCSYCSNNRLSEVFKGQKRLRKLRPELVVRELEEAKKLIPGLRKVMFYEDDFFCRDEEELAELLDLYKEKIGLAINVNGTIKNITERKIDMILARGIEVEFVKLGLQSASSRVNREVYRRPFRPEEYLEKIPMLIGKGIPLTVDMISCSPYETRADKIEAVHFFHSLSRRLAAVENSGKLLEFMDHKLMFYPGTELYEKALKDGIISRDYINDVLLARRTNRHDNEIEIDRIIFFAFRRSLRYRIPFLLKFPSLLFLADNALTRIAGFLLLKMMGFVGRIRVKVRRRAEPESVAKPSFLN